MFGFCITHILNTECAKIKKKKIRRQKVNVAGKQWNFFRISRHLPDIFVQS